MSSYKDNPDNYHENDDEDPLHLLPNAKSEITFITWIATLLFILFCMGTYFLYLQILE
jgi:hypothetical protein